MNCAACRRDNAANRRFCGACGANLAANCESCMFENAAIDSFCGGCGGAMRVRFPTNRGLTELSGLFTSSDEDQGPAVLPDKLSQGDLDRLFGASS